ncbi:hypothetical protein FGO68_gene17517 [Halteria grandinella]|uniref:Uncharacterized protein n=1 Tax=Halteria grandinella TaxID=5974 RepID=A0A8J8P5J9_HALGN|nr:hypothetical protein FGO68_gene17517 [Halteria grandinella]
MHITPLSNPIAKLACRKSQGKSLIAFKIYLLFRQYQISLSYYVLVVYNWVEPFANGNAYQTQVFAPSKKVVLSQTWLSVYRNSSLRLALVNSNIFLATQNSNCTSCIPSRTSIAMD